MIGVFGIVKWMGVLGRFAEGDGGGVAMLFSCLCLWNVKWVYVVG